MSIFIYKIIQKEKIKLERGNKYECENGKILEIGEGN